jgi:chromosome segregation ATPase
VTQSTRTTAAIAARQRSTEQMLDRVRRTITQMHRERARITTAAVARRADVSRTFLYQNTAARALLSAAAQHAPAPQAEDQEGRAVQTASAWKERALNAEDALKAAGAEIRTQRTSIGQLLGKIRDLELDLPEDAVQRLVTENTTLKHQLRQATQDHQRLEERLQAARENNRFLDKRIADLEAELAEHITAARQPSSRQDLPRSRMSTPSPTPDEQRLAAEYDPSRCGPQACRRAITATCECARISTFADSSKMVATHRRGKGSLDDEEARRARGV